MNAKTTVGTAAVLVLVFLVLGAIGSGSASLLSIKYPDKNPAVPAGSLIAISRQISCTYIVGDKLSAFLVSYN